MKRALVLLATVVLPGCTEPAPTAPSLLPQNGGYSPTSVWGMVIEASGSCIRDAKIDVVQGQRLGETITQDTPCGYWDYAGGFEIKNLTPGIELTLRASAPGYITKDLTVVPASGGVHLVLFPVRE